MTDPQKDSKLTQKIDPQSYQEVIKHVKFELEHNGDQIYGNKNYQKYFFDLKKENPNRFIRLIFNTNGQEPFSRDLEDVLCDLSFFKRCEYFGKGLTVKKINEMF